MFVGFTQTIVLKDFFLSLTHGVDRLNGGLRLSASAH